jgi:hypothetical protein
LDAVVLDLNREAYEKLKTDKRLAIVPGTAQVFEEPGTLQEVARLAGDWFNRHVK